MEKIDYFEKYFRKFENSKDFLMQKFLENSKTVQNKTKIFKEYFKKIFKLNQLKKFIIILKTQKCKNVR